MALRIPKSFSYKGQIWQVEYVADLHLDEVKCLGLCDTEARLISIEKNITKPKQLQAFYHELYHVITHEAHIPPDGIMTETVEDILAEAFASLISTMFTLKRQK